MDRVARPKSSWAFASPAKAVALIAAGLLAAGAAWAADDAARQIRAHVDLVAIDDRGRPMVLANWNTDMGDGVEWSNAEEYPGYLKHTADSYRMFINEIIYTLTH